MYAAAAVAASKLWVDRDILTEEAAAAQEVKEFLDEVCFFHFADANHETVLL